MAFVLPRLRGVASWFDCRDATIKPWRRQDPQCARRPVPPTAVRGRVVSLQASCEPAGLWGGHRPQSARHASACGACRPPDHRVGSGIPVSTPGRELGRPGDRGAVRGDRDRPPPRQGLGAQPHVGRPAPLLGGIVSLGRARLGGERCPRFLHPLHGLRFPLDQGLPGILGALRRAPASRPWGPHRRRGALGDSPTTWGRAACAGFFESYRNFPL